MAPNTQEDGFREIQLSGKQLVFLFMAVTVVSVVIFLFGVLVGRDVRVRQSPEGTEASVLTEPVEADRARETSGAVVTPGQDPTLAAAPPVPAREDLSYPDRLGKAPAGKEALKPDAPVTIAPDPRPAAPQPAAPAKAPTPAKAPVPAAPAPAPAASGSGYAVQVAALNVRSEAETIARRLSAKGYAAYVQPPASNRPSVYRVRVGTFKTKREADTVAARLKKEEKFTPWVTR